MYSRKGLNELWYVIQLDIIQPLKMIYSYIHWQGKHFWVKKVGYRIICMVHIYIKLYIYEKDIDWIVNYVASRVGILHDLKFLYHFMLLGISMYYFIIIKLNKAIFIMGKQSSPSFEAYFICTFSGKLSLTHFPSHPQTGMGAQPPL